MDKDKAIKLADEITLKLKELVALVKDVPAPAKNYIDLWSQAIQEFEGYFVGSRSYRNRNPGNLRFAGQPLAIGKDGDSFAIFKTYDDGLATLKLMLRNACSGKSSVYKPTMTILQFFQKYAPSSDNNYPDKYAAFVANKMGVDIGIQIKNLI